MVNCTTKSEKKNQAKKKYGMKGYPTVVFLDSKGRILDRMIGNRKAAYVVKTFRRIRREAEEKSAVRWRTDLEAALSTAKKEKKPVLLYFVHAYCPRNLDKMLSDRKIVEASRKYVSVRVRVDCTKETIRICRKYDIGLFPTVLLLGPGGDERKRFSGTPQDPAKVSREMKKLSGGKP